jgi:hypothetical protein
MTDLSVPMPGIGSGTSSENESASTRRRRQRSNIKTSTLMTALPFIVTGATFLMSFLFQVYQQRYQSREAVDTEWRKALEHVASKNPTDAALGAYQMESFLTTPHGDQARIIVATLLPRVEDHGAFDAILFDFFPGVTQANQDQLIGIDSALSHQLNDLYSQAIKSGTRDKDLPLDPSFGHFLLEPEKFFDDNVEAESLRDTLEMTWELDSVSKALSQVWTGNDHPRLSAVDQDLSGVILFNNDFRAIDFPTKADDAVDLVFYGKCKVDAKKVPPSAKVECVRGENK